MVYSTPSAVPNAAPLHRCCNASGAASGCSGHFLSVDPACEGHGGPLELVGYLSRTRGRETLRALRRCGVEGHPSLRKHALDLPCSSNGTESVLLGFVR